MANWGMPDEIIKAGDQFAKKDVCAFAPAF